MPQFKRLGEQGAVVDEKRTFFGSELIAKAYKVFGIYNSDKSGARIYPKHFSSRKSNSLNLVNAALGEEMVVEDTK